MDAGNAAAIHVLGGYYKKVEPYMLSQIFAKANELWQKVGELGCGGACQAYILKEVGWKLTREES